MKKLVVVLMSMGAVAAAGGCGKSKDKDGGGAGASCADAAANYVTLQLAERLPTPLKNLKPTPDQVKALTAQLTAMCTDGAGFAPDNDKGWSGSMRTCIAKAQPAAKLGDDDPANKCFGRDYWVYPAQVVHDFVEAEKAKAAAAPPPPPPPAEPPPSTGSADPAAGSGSGSAPAAGSGSGSAP